MGATRRQMKPPAAAARQRHRTRPEKGLTAEQRLAQTCGPRVRWCLESVGAPACCSCINAPPSASLPAPAMARRQHVRAGGPACARLHVLTPGERAARLHGGVAPDNGLPGSPWGGLRRLRSSRLPPATPLAARSASARRGRVGRPQARRLASSRLPQAAPRAAARARARPRPRPCPPRSPPRPARRGRRTGWSRCCCDTWPRPASRGRGGWWRV